MLKRLGSTPSLGDVMFANEPVTQKRMARRAPRGSALSWVVLGVACGSCGSSSTGDVVGSGGGSPTSREESGGSGFPQDGLGNVFPRGTDSSGAAGGGANQSGRESVAGTGGGESELISGGVAFGGTGNDELPSPQGGASSLEERLGGGGVLIERTLGSSGGEAGQSGGTHGVGGGAELVGGGPNPGDLGAGGATMAGGAFSGEMGGFSGVGGGLGGSAGAAIGGSSSGGRAGSGGTHGSGGGGSAVCPSPRQNCAGVCVDFSTDPSNCGSCGRACRAGALCSEWSCEFPLLGPIARNGQWVLEFGKTFLEVVPEGGRITAWGQKTHNLLTHANSQNYGSVLWTSPQSNWGWPPPTALDSEMYAASLVGETLALSSGLVEFGGIRISVIKRFSPDRNKEAINIQYVVKNEGASSVNLAAWEVTRVAPDGLEIFPQGAGTFTSAIPTTRLDGTVWVGPVNANDKKLFADGKEGWLAHLDGTLLFVKQWLDVVPTFQAPNEAEVEVYDAAAYRELEVQGPYVSIAPGGTSTFTVRWAVRELSLSSLFVGDDRILTAVRQVLDEISD